MNDDVAAYKERMLKELRARNANLLRLLELWLWKTLRDDVQSELITETTAAIESAKKPCSMCEGTRRIFDELALEMRYCACRP